MFAGLHPLNFLLMCKAKGHTAHYVHLFNFDTMLKIPAAQGRVVERRFPRFAKAVNTARLLGNVPVLTNLDEFVPEDMAFVYACLWYAYSKHVDVTFVASNPPSRNS